jgi:acyl-CoA thioesterase FadM
VVFPFTARIPVRVTDLNHGGHVGNDRLVSLLHEARVAYLAHLGAAEAGVDGRGLILRRLEVDYRREIRHGHPADIELAPAQVRGASFTLFYRVRVAGELAAQAVTEMGGFDYVRRRPVPLDPGLRARLAADAALTTPPPPPTAG